VIVMTFGFDSVGTATAVTLKWIDLAEIGDLSVDSCGSFA